MMNKDPHTSALEGGKKTTTFHIKHLRQHKRCSLIEDQYTVALLQPPTAQILDFRNWQLRGDT